MKLDLRFTAHPLEDLWCDAVVVFVFGGAVSSGKNEFSEIDCKTSGALTALMEKGFFTGTEGETLLVASQGMIRANKILLKGLGRHSGYSRDLFSEKLKEVGDSLERMKVNDIGIRIPVITGRESEYLSDIGMACRHLVDFFLSRHKEDAGFLLKIVVSLNNVFLVDLESTVRQMKGYLEKKLDYSVVFDRTDFES